MLPTFLNSALLWGLALASVPIIIHLLFRRRFRRIDWAPMRYLKLSIQRNRRRIRLEQLLLLLIRTAMVALLFFLVARPVMHAAGLGAWLTGGSRSSQILVIDDSLSMGVRERGRSAFERAQDLALAIFKNVGAKDRFTLVLASQPRTPLLAEIEGAKADKVSELVRECRPSDGFTSWEPTLAAVAELVTAGVYPIREVTIITDLRRAGWEKDLAKIGDRWAGERVRLRIFDVGSEATPGNLSLDSLEQNDRLALVGTPTHWTATVRNGGASQVDAQDATFYVDGNPTLARLPAIGPGESARLPLTATFQEAGLHHISLKLPNDDLEADNQRWRVVSVQPNVHIVLVDGEPSSEPFGGEVDFLSLAMSLGAEDSDAFRVEIATDSEWSAALDAKPDLLVLANVVDITPAQGDRLKALVSAGMGLMIFPGEQLDPDKYNQLLYADGEGILPAPLETISDEEVSGLLVDASDGTPLQALLGLTPAVLERIAIHKFYQVKAPAEDAKDVRVLARWNNATGSPAVLERTVGKGRVLFWTVTADKQWSDWPTEPSYVLAVREAAIAIAQSDTSARTLVAGAMARHELAAGHEVDSPTVDAPGADASQPLKVEDVGLVEPPAERAAKALVVPDTRHAGLYKLHWKETPGGPQSDQFAINPDERESDLGRIESEEVKRLLGAVGAEVISASGDVDTTLAVRGQEIWRPLAFCLLGLAAFEACFATWTGRQR